MSTANFPSDCLPPEREYSSRAELEAAINDWARPRGYAFRCLRSRLKGNKQHYRAIYTCDRSGEPPKRTAPRVRKTSSKKTGCQFSVIANQTAGGWALIHRQGAQYSEHNHEPSLDAMAHPVHRRLDNDTKDLIIRLSFTGAKPQVIRHLIQPQNKLATRKDIANCIEDYKRAQQLIGRSAMQALVTELDKDGIGRDPGESREVLPTMSSNSKAS